MLSSIHPFSYGLLVGIGIALSFYQIVLKNLTKTSSKRLSPSSSSPQQQQHCLVPVSQDELLLLQTEQLARNYAFLGEKMMACLLNDTFIIIVGCGTIGSHAAHMLVRSGIGYLRFIDSQDLHISDLAKVPLATRDHLGTLKVDTLMKQCRIIAPWVHIETCPARLNKENVEKLLTMSSSLPRSFQHIYVVDCIPFGQEKVELLAYCCKHRIPVMSTLQASGKLNPSCIRVSPLTKKIKDPIAKSLFEKLKEIGPVKGITLVYLDEPSIDHHLLSLPEFHDKARNTIYSNPNALIRAENTVPSSLPIIHSSSYPTLCTLPALLGYYLATEIIRKIYYLHNNNNNNPIK